MSIAHLKHPEKKLLDEAETVALELLAALAAAGIGIREMVGDLESIYLYEMEIHRDTRLGLEVHYELSRSKSAAMLELVFKESDDPEADRASLFRLAWWSDKGWRIDLDTVADNLPASQLSRSFAHPYGLREKGDTRPLKDGEQGKILEDVIAFVKTAYLG